MCSYVREVFNDDSSVWTGFSFLIFFFFSSRRRHTRCREVSWARRCVQETAQVYSPMTFCCFRKGKETTDVPNRYCFARCGNLTVQRMITDHIRKSRTLAGFLKLEMNTPELSAMYCMILDLSLIHI
eukprot:TRINITY_DN11336_c0_g1_i1.p4 TRINITY_DN11336_c0_g1~~TRINITY_DN11336_c0_g1_i1.p4  ORF type:complete len:127 (+),score=26.13 TRINITY_DN11336_c0_g1_i1:34-414(+)